MFLNRMNQLINSTKIVFVRKQQLSYLSHYFIRNGRGKVIRIDNLQIFCLPDKQLFFCTCGRQLFETVFLIRIASLS